MMHVGVVARGDEIASSRVLATMLARFHPDWPVTVLVLPGVRPALHPDAEPFRTIVPGDLRVTGLEALALTLPHAALAALLRPLLVAHLLDGGAERVLLLSAVSEVHGPLDALEALLDEHPAVLSHRVRGPLPEDGMHPDGGDLLDAGEVDDGLVAVRADGRPLVDWWVARGHEAASATGGREVATANGRRAARRLGASPLGAARLSFADLGWMEDPGYGVSVWNLHARPLARDGATATAGGAPLRIVQFPGFRADRPWWLSDHADRVLVLDDPVLTDLCRERAAALVAAGWFPVDEIALERHELPNGLVLDEHLRRLHAEAVDAGEDFGDLVSPAGAAAFESWLLEPAPVGARWGLTRYAHHVWRLRPDVQGAYPDLDGDDGEGFVGWLWVHGRPELKLQALLLPSPPGWVEGIDRRLPAVVVTGFLRGTLGLGEAARGYVSALQAAGVPVATRSVSLESGRDEEVFEDLALDPEHDLVVDLAAINPDQMPLLAEELGGASHHVIGLWAWETDVVPEHWEPALEIVDELWAYSDYVAENLARVAPVPVVVVPPPIAVPAPSNAELPPEIPDGFVFLFVFDFFSVLQRKNPLALVEAFKAAFAPGEGPTLVLKTMNSDARPEGRERLRWAIGDRPDVVWIDRSFTAEQMRALYERGDCYVSLHRSEGFGITLAESMARGKPVIATGFSGNTDFMSPANSYLVDWKPTAVGLDAEHYPAEGTWAEPSVEHAAALMREVWEDQDAARRRGARAASDIAARLSPQAVGAIARARLERIAARHDAAAGRTAPYPLSEVSRRLRFDLEGGGATGGARGLARRGVMRVLAPYARSERHLDEAVAASLERLHLDLEAERASRERDRLRIVRLEQRLADLLSRRD